MRGQQMQDAKPTTRFFPDKSGLRFAQLPSHCLLSTAYRLLATSSSCRVPAATLYTGGHLLETHRKSLTLSHFSTRSERVSDGKARFVSRVIPNRSGLPCGLPWQGNTMWDVEPKSLISKSAGCSLSQGEIPMTNSPAAPGHDGHLSPGREPRAHLVPERLRESFPALVDRLLWMQLGLFSERAS
jgi:hypothetical protein